MHVRRPAALAEPGRVMTLGPILAHENADLNH